ncbi:hypothetical protein [Prescottella equi]|uniref:hypothetical protein n=1 Tax=Rhodococcus hoagii TaxID=43767 RepID=UPI000A114901|nr:hypothetical protein [Prescottella equi]ORL73305.1 hypothetical protein A5N71_20800 [Prescottella equi]
MAASVNHRRHGWSDRHPATSRVGVVLVLAVLSLIPGVVAAGLGRSPFAIFWLVVLTGLALGTVAAILPSSWSD